MKAPMTLGHLQVALAVNSGVPFLALLGSMPDGRQVPALVSMIIDGETSTQLRALADAVEVQFPQFSVNPWDLAFSEAENAAGGAHG